MLTAASRGRCSKPIIDVNRPPVAAQTARTGGVEETMKVFATGSGMFAGSLCIGGDDAMDALSDALCAR